jgi:chromosome segregation ATPase
MLDELRKVQSDAEYLSSQNRKLREEVLRMSDERDSLLNKLEVDNRNKNAQIDRVKSELAELNKRMTALKSLNSQYAHTIQRKDREYSLLEERLQKVSRINRNAVTSSVELSTASSRFPQSATRRQWGTDSNAAFNSNLLDTLSLANQDLVHENTSLRKSLAELQEQVRKVARSVSDEKPDAFQGQEHVFQALEDLSTSIAASTPFELVRQDYEICMDNALRVLEARIAEVHQEEAARLQQLRETDNAEIKQLRSLVEKYRDIVDHQERVLAQNLDRFSSHGAPATPFREAFLRSPATPARPVGQESAGSLAAPSTIARKLMEEQERLHHDMRSAMSEQGEVLMQQARKLDAERRAFESERTALEDQIRRLNSLLTTASGDDRRLGMSGMGTSSSGSSYSNMGNMGVHPSPY